MKYTTLVFCVFIFISCNKTPKSNLNDKKEIAREIIVNAKNCALITVDINGVAHARTMDPFLPEEDFTIWMATNPKSLKVSQIQENSKTTLYYFDAKTVSYVTLQGNSEIINSNEKKEKFWKEEWKNFYKNRTTDYLLIKFTPKSGTVVSEKYNILGDSITWQAPSLKF